MSKLNKKSIFDDFTNKYSLSKTLRFELRPVNERSECFVIDQSNESLKEVLKEDEQRAENYKKIKHLIDDMHRNFIDEVLSGDFLSASDIEKAFREYEKFKASSKDLSVKDRFQETQSELRKKISKSFTQNPKYKKLFDKEIITLLLDLESKKSDGGSSEKNSLIKSFEKWTTYFRGFHKNRKNIYKAEEEVSISYRVVNENMVKFFDNCIAYKKAMTEHPDINISKAQKDLSGKLDGQ